MPLESSTGQGRAAQSVCAVLVTFNPDPATLESAVAAASRQVGKLLLVDNGSSYESLAKTQATVDRYREALPDRATVSLRALGANRGLPVAFNTAIDLARDHRSQFLLLLDHDSVLADGVVETLLHEYDQLSVRMPVGAVEAINVEPAVLPTDDFLEGYLRRRGRVIEGGVTEEFLATNSGLLIPLAMFDRAGKFDESYFVDAVDFEFALRLRSLGWPIFRVPAARILHRRGEPAESHLGAVRWRLRRIAPQRHYYVGRETLRLSWRYARRYPLVALFLLSMPLRETALILLFYPRRGPHLRALAVGMLHAATGVRGPFSIQ